MTDIAIQVENLSKMYRIGGQQARYKRFTEAAMDVLTAPLQRLRRLGQPTPPAETIWALKDVSFEVKEGEVVGVIGRNGAGKSTLLKILSRITEPTEGEARVYGRVGSLLEVGTGFHPELTGRENIYLNGAILGMRRAEIERKFDEIVAFAEVEKFLDTPVKRYSSGMYMRLAFSVAAHLEPEILLVDEVLAVGDVTFQKKCLGQMERVARNGRTVLFVSHNLAAVKQICQYGVLLHEGNIILQGEVNRVVQEYIGVATANGNSIELTPYDHITGVNGILARNIRLLNSQGDSFSIAWKTPMQLQIEIEVTKPISNVVLGLGVTTLEGVPLFTVHHTDRTNQPLSFTPGIYRIKIEVDNPLRVGMYNIILGAHEAIAKSSIFYIPNAIRMEVIVSASDTNEDYYEHNSGLINGRSSWLISEAV